MTSEAYDQIPANFFCLIQANVNMLFPVLICKIDQMDSKFDARLWRTHFHIS